MKEGVIREEETYEKERFGFKEKNRQQRKSRQTHRESSKQRDKHESSWHVSVLYHTQLQLYYEGWK